MKLAFSSPTRRNFWIGAALGALFLAVFETFSSLVRAQFLPATPFFQFPTLYLGAAWLKSLVFGPLLGVLTWKIAGFWRRKMWDEACYGCLRGGFALGIAPAVWALACFLFGERFPLLAWPARSWGHFALWLTLNVSLIWSLLLIVAGFLLPHDSRKTIQISDKVRF